MKNTNSFLTFKITVVNTQQDTLVIYSPEHRKQSCCNANMLLLTVYCLTDEIILTKKTEKKKIQ